MSARLMRVAAVTGAGSGVGRHCALALLRDGYNVALLGRRSVALEETRSRAAARNRCLVIPTDVTREEDVVRAFEQITRFAGRLDVLRSTSGRGLWM